MTRRPTPSGLSPLERAFVDLLDDRLGELREDIRRHSSVTVIALVLVAAVAAAAIGRDLVVDAPGVKVGTSASGTAFNEAPRR